MYLDAKSYITTLLTILVTSYTDHLRNILRHNNHTQRKQESNSRGC